MSSGIGHRGALDPALLCPWCGPGATASILLLAWKPPYAVDVALKRPKKKKKKKTSKLIPKMVKDNFRKKNLLNSVDVALREAHLFSFYFRQVKTLLWTDTTP